MPQKKVTRLLSDLKRGMIPIYGKRLRGIYLFGSYARGEQDAESDLDILLVLEDYDRYSTEIINTGELVSKLSLKYGVSISRTFLKEQEWLNGDSPLLRNARQEAIPA